MNRFGKGSAQAVQNLDIPAKSAMTWLYERRLVPYDWSKLILAVTAKFEELAEAFPFDHAEEEVRKTGQYLKENIKDYGTAKEVLRMLTESKTECAEKNFFGGYKH